MAAAPGWASVLGGWVLSPVADLAIAGGTAGYGWLARKVRGGWPAWRSASWVLAMLVLAVAVSGPVARFADTLFWVHMVQHLLLIMIGPVLVVWAQPVRLVREGLGRRVGAGLDRVWALRPVRWATAPLTGLAGYTALVVLTHLTGFQQLSVTHSWVRAVELVAYLGCGWLFFWPLLGGELGPWSLPYLLRFVVLGLGMGADTLTGVALMLTSRPLAPAYATAHPGWGPTALGDQEIAGAIMWFGGDLVMMVLMVVVAVAWGRAGSEAQGLGHWLEGARRRSLLGAESGPNGPVPDTGPYLEPYVDPSMDTDMDVDSDERALRAYNAALAALHERSSRAGVRPERDEREPR